MPLNKRRLQGNILISHTELMNNELTVAFVWPIAAGMKKKKYSKFAESRRLGQRGS